MQQISYALGMVIGRNLGEMGAKAIDEAAFARAVAAVLKGEATEMTAQEAEKKVALFVQEQREEQAKEARNAGEDFLRRNAEKEGVTTLESGLQYEVLREGKGRSPKATDRVRCHYEGRLTDGTVFDSSYRRGQPADFPLSGVIKGWTEGLQLMHEGAKHRLFIPYHLAYGAQGAGGSIPPYAALVFDVELMEVL